jgi:hypothetical protein
MQILITVGLVLVGAYLGSKLFPVDKPEAPRPQEIEQADD